MSEKAFVMSYFRTRKEALHLAVSDDGYHWTSLNRNRPILASHLRTRTLRDPYLFRDRTGLFHLLATDGWTSPYIIHARSEDLLGWQGMQAIPLMVGIPGARNSWAPEVLCEGNDQGYRVIWSSTVSTSGPPDLRDHRIWSAVTEDFRRFETPALFFDPGYSCIDATVCMSGDERVMAFKDERGENRPNTPYKAIRLVTSKRDSPSWSPVSDILTPPLTEGPILFRCHDRWMLFYDLYMDGSWGASVSVDLESWVDVTRGVEFPDGPRHGSVIEVDRETVDLLRRRS